MRRRGLVLRRRLVANAQLARELRMRPGRGERFRLRQERDIPLVPDFPELLRWPRWPNEDDETKSRIWAVTAVVSARDSLADEIDGERLRRYAAAVADDELERVLALPRGGDRRLAPPDGLAAQGRTIAESALPPSLALRLGLPPLGDADAASNVAHAEAIVGP